MPKGKAYDPNTYPVGSTTWVEEWYYDPSLDLNFKTKLEGDWLHFLYTHIDEEAPDSNHVHVKQHLETNSFVLCRVKINGGGNINRAQLIKRINAATGLDIKR